MAVEAAKIVINVGTEGMSQATAESKNFDNSMQGLNLTIQKFAKAAAEFAVIKNVISFLGSATAAFGEAQASAMRLDSALKMRNMQSSADAVKKLSQQMQNLIGVDGDLVNQIQAELILQGKSEAQTKRLITAAANLSAVTGDDLQTSVQQLNLSLSGSARALAKMNPEIGAMTEEQLKAGGAIDVITQKYGGMAEAMEGSLEVQRKVAEQARGDAEEAFGEALAPAMLFTNQVMTELIKTITDVLNVFNALPGPVKLVIGGMVGLVTALMAYNLLQKSTIVQTGIILAKQAIEIVRKGVLTVTTWAQTAAQVGLNAATIVGLTLTGVGIALVGAAIAAGVAYAASQAEQADAINETSDALRNMGDLLVDTTKKAFESMTGGATIEEFKKLQDVLNENKNAIEGIGKAQSRNWLTQKEALEEELKLKKANLDAQIEYGKSLDTDFALKNQSKVIQKYREDLAKTETALNTLNNAQKTKEEADKEAKKVAEDLAKIEEERQGSIDKTIEKLKEEIATVNLSEKEKIKYNLVQKNAMADEIEYAQFLQGTLDALREKTDAEKKATELREQSKTSYQDLLKNLEDEGFKATHTAEEYAQYAKAKQDAADVKLLQESGLSGGEFDTAISNIRKMREEAEKVPPVLKTWVDVLSEVTSALNSVGSIMGSIGQINQNITDENLANLQRENEDSAKAWQAKIDRAEKEGATAEEIAALKSKAADDQKRRDEDYQKDQRRFARENAILQKSFAMFNAVVNAPAAIINAFASPGGVLAGVLMSISTAAQIAAIASTPIPQAQFGGSFQVPPGMSGDSGLLRVNSGEQVSVTPTRESGRGGGTMVLSIDGREFEGFMEEQVNKALNSGRVSTGRKGVVRA